MQICQFLNWHNRLYYTFNTLWNLSEINIQRGVACDECVVIAQGDIRANCKCLNFWKEII